MLLTVSTNKCTYVLILYSTIFKIVKEILSCLLFCSENIGNMFFKSLFYSLVGGGSVAKHKTLSSACTCNKSLRQVSHILVVRTWCLVCPAFKATVCSWWESVAWQGLGQMLRGQWQLQMVPFHFWRKQMVVKQSKVRHRGVYFESGFWAMWRGNMSLICDHEECKVTMLLKEIKPVDSSGYKTGFSLKQRNPLNPNPHETFLLTALICWSYNILLGQHACHLVT